MIRELTIDTLTNELVTCARIKGHRCTWFCANPRSFNDACLSIEYKLKRGSLIGVRNFERGFLGDYYYAFLVFNNGNELTLQIYSDDEFKREYYSERNILYEPSLGKRVEAIMSIIDDGVGMVIDDKELIQFLSSFKINK